ncbi:cysteine desulfurase [Hellea sp.]|jgi:cysteine desulfurase/selenocysteine lyase|nr:cysteine desulfurase [Hellea sp.]
MTIENNIHKLEGFDIHAVRKQFPILNRKVNNYGLAYLDNAASAQKPLSVINAISEQMSQSYGNVHRGLHTLANETTEAYENSRIKVANFLGASKASNIIFTKGATEALNLAAYGLMNEIQPGDEIILSQMEHHSNIVPWHFLRERCGAVLKYIPVTEQGNLDLEIYKAMLGPKTKIVSIVHMSNVLGTINPVKEIGQLAHNSGAIFIVDGTQSTVHMPIDVMEIDADLFCMTGHKLYGPTGIGALYAKTSIQERMQPFNGGGEMIEDVFEDRVTYNDPPFKFEAGTPPILEAIGLGAAIDWYSQYNFSEIHKHENSVYNHALKQLMSIENFKIFGISENKGPVLAFNIEGIHAHDVAQILDKYGVAIRAGQHCTQPLMNSLGIHSTARASFGIYNTIEEADRFVEGLKRAIKFLS